MRKFLFLALSLGLLGFTTITQPTNYSPAVSNVAIDCTYGQCNATAKSTGNRCKHCVSNSGDSYCYQHK